MEPAAASRPDFSALVYRRPDEAALAALVAKTADRIRGALNAAAVADAVVEFERERLALNDLKHLADIRFVHGPDAEAYEVEVEVLAGLQTMMGHGFEAIADALHASRFERETETLIGSLYYAEARRYRTAFSAAIGPELAEERRLVTQLDALLGSAGWLHPDALSFVWDDAEKVVTHEERLARQHDEVEAFNSSLKARAQIVSELIALRDQIARKRGYRHYIEYARHASRLDLSLQRDRTAFREYVETYFVPLGEAIRKQQAKRLGLNEIASTELYTLIPERWPEPEPDARQELSAAFDELVEEVFGDKASRVKGLIGGGYVTLDRGEAERLARPSRPLLSAGSAFLSAGDDGVSTFLPRLMYAAGSAYADLSAFAADRRLGVSGADRFSRALAGTAAVWLSAPRWERLLGRAAGIALELDLTRHLLELPRLTAIDEFEEQLYLHPEMTVHERNQLWRQLERRYEPTVAAADKAGPFPYGSVWLRHIDFLRRPLTTLDQAIADVAVLAGRPFTRRYGTSKLALTLSSYLETGFGLDCRTRLAQAGFPDPFREASFRRASFAAADELML